MRAAPTAHIDPLVDRHRGFETVEALIGPVLLGAQVVVARILIAVVEEGAREKVVEGELQHATPQLDRYVEIGRRRPGERNRALGPEAAAREAVNPGLGNRRMLGAGDAVEIERKRRRLNTSH